MYQRELKQYLELQRISNQLAQTISDYYHIRKTQIRWWNVTEYFIELKKITITPLNKNQFNKLINSDYGIYGLTIINKYLSMIYYNNTSIPSRQHFTILHELSHIQLHSNMKNESYSSLIINNDYSEEDTIKEQEANILASQLLINDSSLIKYINQGFTFKQICHEFEISQLALKTRIINHIKIYVKVKNKQKHKRDNYIRNPYVYANKIVEQYISGEQIKVYNIK